MHVGPGGRALRVACAPRQLETQLVGSKKSEDRMSDRLAKARDPPPPYAPALQYGYVSI